MLQFKSVCTGYVNGLCLSFRFSSSFLTNSKPIVPLDDGGEVTGSAVRSYVTVERPTGGKQIRKAKQQTPGRTGKMTCLVVFL